MMTADIFGERVNNDISTLIERAAQIRRGHGAIDDKRNAVTVGHLSQLFDVDHISRRIADRFAE